jgi:excisionase family DNA binding protein
MTTTVTPISIRQAAESLGLKIWPVYEMTERGELPYAMLHGRRLVGLEDLDALDVNPAPVR